MQHALPGGNSALRDRMTARLRHTGLRPTRQRVELGCILFAKGHRHITAEDLHAEADVAGYRVSPSPPRMTAMPISDPHKSR